VSLEEYKMDIEGCSRCSSCKWLPQGHIKSWQFAKVCPAFSRYHFNAYSGGGKLQMANSLLHGRSEICDEIAEIVYKCMLCGGCEVSCKAYRDDIDSLEVFEAFRALCVEQGFLIPELMDVIENMKKEDNPFGMAKGNRGNWSNGMEIADINKQKVDVLFHAGCRFSYDEELWPTVQNTIKLLNKAGVNVGIAGKDEACCGGRAYEMGYQGVLNNYSEDMISRIRASGARLLVTPCADCYSAFKYFYPWTGRNLGVEVLHISELLFRLMKQGKIRFLKKLPLRVTYHDPCHLGRRSEPPLGKWEGNKLLRPLYYKRSGRHGIYDPPRSVIQAIPDIEFVEMERIRQHSWCCGAGGGVRESDPDLSMFTAKDRIDEAVSTGADALVTACPWCERNLKDSLKERDTAIEVYDLVDIVFMAIGDE